MINFNGELVNSQDYHWVNNRSFQYGDGVFDTLKMVDGNLLFAEDHYFRLMASMRIVRMQIPMNFTQEFLTDQILQTVQANQCLDSARIRITVYRNSGGYYLPETSEVGYVIQASAHEHKQYPVHTETCEVDLYKDFHIAKNLLSTLKTTSKMVHVTGSIFAQENGLQNCLLLNDSKNVVEALNGNLFMLQGQKLITPPLSEGCLNGIMRKKTIALARQLGGIQVSEEVISPFDLQAADELFITNVVAGIKPITQYRKKQYSSHMAQQLTHALNESLQL